MVLDEKCVTHGWSAITSAATHSQLAGVLAGFLFTGIVLLFERASRDHAQTIALFTSTFLVLALDSYEFSLIAGVVVTEGRGREECPLIWSQGMPASGSLAVGATALTCGVAWLLSDYSGPTSGSSDSAPSKYMTALGGAVVSVMILGSMPLLTATTIDYFQAVYQGNGIESARYATLAIGSVLTFSGTALTVWRTYRRITQNGQLRHPRVLPTATFVMLGYAFAGLVFTGLISLSSVDTMNDPSLIIVGFGFALGMLVPGFIIGILLPLSIPSSGQTAPSNQGAAP